MSNMMKLITTFVIFSSSITVAFSFAFAFSFQQQSIRIRSERSRSVSCFGIQEWRDNVFDDDDDTSTSTSNTAVEELAKPICLLPFPAKEGILQGQTKELRLYEDRFLELFDQCINHHEGVLAMALIDSDIGAVLQSVPLCQIEAYQRMDQFGIFVTIRAVGR
eukprot:CAMPEP_0202465470 /NCGR_PEP_ID=MMETSP1360-20130828/65722_1 /ASSEMBLY_ACC=CAM_ASM_000848 /TAXON_ID=515479 /ORGANISM="Licmophora paradoxa, Strain CCMP2313" /LENGTH=162 /DNA_ID=CAMNT_0049089221 /DNA_START=68 /DNA_END=552 /DNA_ORIENTATION=-